MDKKSRTAEPNFYMEYTELTQEFEVCEVKKRHENGNRAESERIATCYEEGDANQIINALNSRERVEALEKELKRRTELLNASSEVASNFFEKVESLEYKLSAMSEIVKLADDLMEQRGNISENWKRYHELKGKL